MSEPELRVEELKKVKSQLEKDLADLDNDTKDLHDAKVLLEYAFGIDYSDMNSRVASIATRLKAEAIDQATAIVEANNRQRRIASQISDKMSELERVKAALSIISPMKNIDRGVFIVTQTLNILSPNSRLNGCKLSHADLWKIIGRPLSQQQTSSSHEFSSITITSPKADLPFLYEGNLRSATVTATDVFDDVIVSMPWTENLYYPLMSQFKPSWIGTFQPNTITAKSMYGSICNGLGWSNIQLSNDCIPELNSLNNEQCTPAFNGEAKSITNLAFEQVAQYCLWGICASYFPHNSPIYYDSPPKGYAIMSDSCPMGYIAMIELIGCCFVSIITKPFFLGSKEHEQSIKYIEYLETETMKNGTDYSSLEPIQINLISNNLHPGIRYSKHPFNNKFIKLIAANTFAGTVQSEPGITHFEKARGDYLDCIGEYQAKDRNWSVTPTMFYHLFKVYKHYLPTCNHSVLVNSVMKFGFLDIVIESDFVHGRHVTVRELAEDANVIQQICDCLKELGRNQLLYIDLRVANVLVEFDRISGRESSPKRVRLVDYDDCVILSKPLCCGFSVGQALVHNCHVKDILKVGDDVHGLRGILGQLSRDACSSCRSTEESHASSNVE